MCYLQLPFELVHAGLQHPDLQPSSASSGQQQKQQQQLMLAPSVAGFVATVQGTAGDRPQGMHITHEAARWGALETQAAADGRKHGSAMHS